VPRCSSTVGSIPVKQQVNILTPPVKCHFQHKWGCHCPKLMPGWERRQPREKNYCTVRATVSDSCVLSKLGSRLSVFGCRLLVWFVRFFYGKVSGLVSAHFVSSVLVFTCSHLLTASSSTRIPEFDFRHRDPNAYFLQLFLPKSRTKIFYIPQYSVTWECHSFGWQPS